jgi:hypothetical protein
VLGEAGATVYVTGLKTRRQDCNKVSSAGGSEAAPASFPAARVSARDR